jgi:hypothetical protein
MIYQWWCDTHKRKGYMEHGTHSQRKMCGTTHDINRICGSHLTPLFASLAKVVQYHSANEPTGNYGCMVAQPQKNSAGGKRRWWRTC